MFLYLQSFFNFFEKNVFKQIKITLYRNFKQLNLLFEVNSYKYI